MNTGVDFQQTRDVGIDPNEGAFLTCMAMFLNGLRTGTETTRSNPHWILIEFGVYKIEEVVLGMTW